MTAFVRSAGRGFTRGVAARPLSRVPLARQLLVVLLVAVLVLATGVWTLYRQAHREALTEQARAAALSASRAHVEEILSYDYRTLDHDIAAAKADTTGKLRDKYGKLTSKLVGPKATKHKVVVRADVVGASVVSASPDEVVTLLFVNQSTRSNLLDEPRLDYNRVEMTLHSVDGKWLASDISAMLPFPTIRGLDT